MIFAAGFGTRLKPFTDHHPKALATVKGSTLLEHTIRYLQRFGIYDVVVNVHHFADQIESAMIDHQGFGSRYTISDERAEILETGGGLLHASRHFQNEHTWVAMNVDVFTDLDLSAMIDEHMRSAAAATLAVMSRPSSRELLFNRHHELCGWRNKQTGEQKMSREGTGLVAKAFSGVQVIGQAVFEVPFLGKFSIIDSYLHLAKQSKVLAFDHTGGLFLDVGKPEALAAAAQFAQQP